VSGNGSPARNVAQRVRRIIGVLVARGRGSPDIQLVADAMETSVRTLQRRLHASGLTYASVLQETRLAAARQLLEDRRLRIGAIARTLGYSDHGHFTRAFQRWTGVTPRDFRHHRGRAERVRARPRRD
jgi:AraC-like DNA-binding protein